MRTLTSARAAINALTASAFPLQTGSFRMASPSASVASDIEVRVSVGPGVVRGIDVDVGWGVGSRIGVGSESDMVNTTTTTNAVMSPRYRDSETAIPGFD